MSAVLPAIATCCHCVMLTNIFWLQVFVEECQQRLIGFDGVVALETVAGAWKRQQFGLDVGRFQFVDQPHGLFVRDVFVFRAVDTQRGGGVRRDPIQRARNDVLMPCRFEVAPQEQRQNLRSVDALAIGFGEIAGPIDIDDAGDVARHPGISAVSFEHRNVRGDSQKLRQVSAGRTSRRANAVGVDVVLFRVGSQPAHGRLRVMHCRGELVLGRQPIADSYGDIALLCEFEAQAVIAVAVPGAKSAAVNAHNCRKRPIAGFRPGHIDLQVLIVGIRVFDSLVEDHACGNRRIIGECRTAGSRDEPERQALRQSCGKGSAFS